MAAGTATATYPAVDPGDLRALRRLYLTRGVLALVWAVAFAGLATALDDPVTALLVLYPLIDVVSSLYDAHRHRSSRLATLQHANAALSLVALVGLAVASSLDQAAVLHVFGVWATVSGVVQLVVALRRRKAVGFPWALLLSGALSTVAGVTFNVMATSPDPALTGLAGYAGLGGVLFLVTALLLTLRLRHSRSGEGHDDRSDSSRH